MTWTLFWQVFILVNTVTFWTAIIASMFTPSRRPETAALLGHPSRFGRKGGSSD